MLRSVLALALAPCCAAAADWQLEPTTCVVENAGQSCDMRVVARTISMSDQSFCFWLGEQALGCEVARDGQLQFELHYDHDMPFTITQNDRIVFQQTLRINSIAAKKRRRIRLPWSLF